MPFITFHRGRGMHKVLYLLTSNLSESQTYKWPAHPFNVPVSCTGPEEVLVKPWPCD